MAYGNTVRLTKETILNKVSQSQIFQYYLGYTPEEGKRYTNPGRTDKKPDCYFYVKNGKIRFRDPAMPLDEDCFGIVMYMERCNFPVALETIAKDFGLYGWSNRVIVNLDNIANETIKEKQRTRFTVRFRKWNLLDAEYWKSFYITSEILNLFNVKPVKVVWIDDRELPSYIYTENDPCYAYIFPDKTIKLYFPLREKGQTRFWNNSSYVQGLNLLPDRGEEVIITKSYKDVLALRIFDIYAIAPQAETNIIDIELINDLKRRFNTIYSLYDWDRAGLRGAYTLKKDHGITPLFFTRSEACEFLGAKVRYNYEKKDFTDNLKAYGYQDMISIINHTKMTLQIQQIIKQEIIPF